MKKNFSFSAPFVGWALAGLGVLIYSNTFKASFVFDDLQAIAGNPAIRNLADLPAIWNAFNTRFIVGISLAFNYALGRENVVGYHLFNLVVHLLNSFLVYQLVCLTFSTPRMAKSSLNPKLMGFLTSLVFLTHPLQTQGVTYIWQRATSLAALFYLGALVFYIKSRLKASWRDYILCLLFTVGGMFTKEIVFTLPFMIVLYEFIFLSSPKSLIGDHVHRFDSRLKHSGMTLLALIPILATLLIIPWTMTKANEHTLKFLRYNNTNTLLGMTRTVSQDKMPRKDFILTEFNVLRTYLRLFVLPVKQSVDYDYPRAKSLLEKDTFLSFILLVGLGGAGYLLLKKHPLLSLGIFWFFLTASVECLVAQEEFIFEHRMYLPMVGVGLFVVMGFGYLFQKRPRGLLILLLGATACYSFLTFQRNFVWKDELTLWDDAIRKFPQKARGYVNRGTVYKNQGLLNQAFDDFDRALKLDPTFARAYSNRGALFRDKGLLDQALADCSKAIEISPDMASAYMNRGVIYKDKNNPDLALLDFNKAIELEPGIPDSYNNRASIYGMRNELDLALADCNKALELAPKFAEAYYNRAVVNKRKGLLDQALRDCDKAIELKPNFALANNYRAYLKGSIKK